MYYEIALEYERMKHFFKSKENYSKKFYDKYIQPLTKMACQDEIMRQRTNYLDLIMIKLPTIPKDIAEMTFNLFHVAFRLEEEIKDKIQNLYLGEYYEKDDCLAIFCQNSAHYLFFTCLLIVAKLCGSSSYHTKVKELIIDMNLHFNTILLCEVLLMNFVDWEIFLFSPSDVIYSVMDSIGVPAEAMMQMQSIVENYVNYVFSEFSIYGAFDLYIISLSISKLVLGKFNNCTIGTSNVFLIKFDNLFTELICNKKQEVEECIDLICNLLEDSDEEPEGGEEIINKENEFLEPSIVF